MRTIDCRRLAARVFCMVWFPQQNIRMEYPA